MTPKVPNNSKFPLQLQIWSTPPKIPNDSKGCEIQLLSKVNTLHASISPFHYLFFSNDIDF